MAKSVLDISAAAETHLKRAENVLLRHSGNVAKAVMVIAISGAGEFSQEFGLDLTEIQEEIQDIAEIMNSMRQDALDILETHIEFAKEVQKRMEDLGKLGYYQG